MFRCPTCIAVLAEPRARRCETCGQNLRRREPFVLGDAAKVSSRQLPIDRWMADRVARHAAPVFRPASAPSQPARPTLTLAPTALETVVELAVEPEIQIEPAIQLEPVVIPMVQPRPTIVPAPVVAPVSAPEPELAPEPEPEPIVEPATPPPAAIVEPIVEPIAEPIAEPVVEPAAIVEPIVEPVVAPIVEPTAQPVIPRFYRKARVEPVPPAAIEPPIEMTALPVEVEEPVEQTVAPELFSAVSAMIAPFIDAPTHELPMHRAGDAVEEARARVAPAPPELGMMLLAVGGEPVRYVDEEMEAALDVLARAAREEILAVNAPAPAEAGERANKDEDSPWLAPIRKAWEPPLEEEQGRGSRWSFFRRTG